MGLHYGHLHDADLGDGLGRKSEHMLVRQHYFPVIGTCWESVRGGHHFRAWRQNGTLANSGAWFIGYAVTFYCSCAGLMSPSRSASKEKVCIPGRCHEHSF